MRVIRHTMLRLTIGYRSSFPGLCRDHAAEMRDVTAQVVGNALVMVRRVDAWPRDGPVAVSRHLVPFLTRITRNGNMALMGSDLFFQGNYYYDDRSALCLSVCFCESSSTSSLALAIVSL